MSPCFLNRKFTSFSTVYFSYCISQRKSRMNKKKKKKDQYQKHLHRAKLETTTRSLVIANYKEQFWNLKYSFLNNMLVKIKLKIDQGISSKQHSWLKPLGYC